MGSCHLVSPDHFTRVAKLWCYTIHYPRLSILFSNSFSKPFHLRDNFKVQMQECFFIKKCFSAFFWLSLNPKPSLIWSLLQRKKIIKLSPLCRWWSSLRVYIKRRLTFTTPPFHWFYSTVIKCRTNDGILYRMMRSLLDVILIIEENFIHWGGKTVCA